MTRIWDSFWISFGVVPEATRAWNPDRAPQAMVMKTNGNSEPAATGPCPSEANRVSASICSDGQASRIEAASSTTTPTFMNDDR